MPLTIFKCMFLEHAITSVGGTAYGGRQDPLENAPSATRRASLGSALEPTQLAIEDYVDSIENRLQLPPRELTAALGELVLVQGNN